MSPQENKLISDNSTSPPHYISLSPRFGSSPRRRPDAFEARLVSRLELVKLVAFCRRRPVKLSSVAAYARPRRSSSPRVPSPSVSSRFRSQPPRSGCLRCPGCPDHIPKRRHHLPGCGFGRCDAAFEIPARGLGHDIPLSPPPPRPSTWTQSLSLKHPQQAEAPLTPCIPAGHQLPSMVWCHPTRAYVAIRS